MLKIFSSGPLLYHGTNKELSPETTLVPQQDGYVNLEIQMETLFDEYRPHDKISRFDSVFLADDIDNIDMLGGYLYYVYLCEPIGQVDKSDLDWYSSAYTYFENYDNSEARKGFKLSAENYWNGIPSGNDMWEYRCRSAKVIRLIEHNPNG